jgi:hypothetical protein
MLDEEGVAIASGTTQEEGSDAAVPETIATPDEDGVNYFRRRKAARPTTPEPSRAIVAGSGTGV